MSKKTNKKKKQVIKLESNQSYMVEDLGAFMHVQKTYALLLRSNISHEERALCARVLSAVDSAIKNVYLTPEEGSNEDYWD